jgi:hypothetical protein
LKVSIVIVNYNGKHFLAPCLNSLKRQSFRDFETIVVDNASTDGSTELLRKKFPFVKVIRNATGLGFPEACNIGIAASKGEYVALLNNDAVADEKWLGSLVSYAGKCDSSVASFASRLMLLKKPGFVNSTGLVIAKNGRARDRDFGAALGRPSTYAQDIFGPSAGAALYRRAALEAVKEPGNQYLRGDYFLYYEDVDLAFKLRWAGFGSKYVHDSVVFHHHAGSTGKTPGLPARMSHTNCQRTILRNFTFRMILQNLHRIVLADIMEMGYVFLKCSPMAPFESKFIILTEFFKCRRWHNEMRKRFQADEKRVSVYLMERI